MNNKPYPQEELNNIKTNFIKLDGFMSDCIEWTESSPDVNDSSQVSKKLKSYRRTLRRLTEVVDNKPAIAFFGASQSGKSHLVKNLLQDDKDKICYVSDKKSNQLIDYLKHINPEGKGNESTALVTRFVKYNSIINESDKPIKAELLNVKDLIICICDGFYSVGNIDKLDYDTNLKSQEAIEKMIPSGKPEDCILTEDDIFFIQEYLTKYKGATTGDLLANLKSNKYWDNLAESIERIPYEEYIDVFKVLWQEQPQFNSLFMRLLIALSQVAFNKYFYCDFDIISRSLPEFYREKFQSHVNILDVRALDNMLYQSDSFSIWTEDATHVTLSSDILCAICKEIILELPEDNTNKEQFINHIDILDFPGSRPGSRISVDREVSSKDIGQAILRGKVNFLFNTYSDEYKLNNLAIVSCLAEQKDGAAQIPEILNNWINNYIGKTAKTREESIQNMGLPPLFVILTYWNKILEFDKKKDDIDARNRLKTAFETRFYQDILSNNTWFDDWIISEKHFKNFYLLRDFNYCTLFEKDENEKELDVKSGNVEFFSNLKKSFSENKKTAQYFRNLKESWDAATTPNLDGSDLIIRNLQQVTSNYPKTKRLVNIALEGYEKFMLQMPKPRLEDVESLVKESKRKASDITTKLGLLVEEGGCLGSLQELFTVKEKDIYEIILNLIKSHDILTAGQLKKYFSFLLQHPELRSDKPKEDKLELLKNKMGYDSIEEMSDVLENDYKFNLKKLFDEDLEKLKKKSTYISGHIKDYWIENILNIDSASYQSDYINSASLTTIGTSLRNNFNKLNMEKYMANAISSYADEIEMNDDALFMVANIITGILNNFVMTAGWNYTDDTERERIRGIATQNMVTTIESTVTRKYNLEEIDQKQIEDVFNDLENEVNIINENIGKGSSEVIINKFSSLYNLTKWQDCLKLSFMANLDKVDYDLKSNEKLKEILKTKEEINIQV